jgi:hypothetical protein
MTPDLKFGVFICLFALKTIGDKKNAPRRGGGGTAQGGTNGTVDAQGVKSGRCVLYNR